MSPHLSQFLATHSGASALFSNVLFEAFAVRSFQLYYFYTDDTNTASAFHFYPAESSVVIVIRENQQPSDQYFCLIFEMLNSEHEKQFEVFSQEVQAGTISRTNFAIGILRQEFGAVGIMKALLRHFNLSKKEMKESYYYKSFTDCPDTFDGYLSYSQKRWSGK